MKRTVLATAIILASVLAFGSGQDDVAADGPVTLQLMEVQEQMWDGFVAVIADWEAATGNKIEVTLIPGNQIEQVLISRINADEAPDIFMSQGASYENLLPPGSVAPSLQIHSSRRPQPRRQRPPTAKSARGAE